MLREPAVAAALRRAAIPVVTGPAYVPPSPAQRIAMRAQNPLVRGLLRSPAHGLLSARVLLISSTGRRSGRSFTLPVQYVREGDEVVVTVGWPEKKTWWRNFTGEPRPVTLRLAGRDVGGTARAVEREDGGVQVRIALDERRSDAV